MVAILACRAGTRRRRRISPEAGKALEKLGHAIDYLMDEFLNAGGSFCGNEPQLKAIRMLMAINRQIYFGCPEVPSLTNVAARGCTCAPREQLWI